MRGDRGLRQSVVLASLACLVLSCGGSGGSGGGATLQPSITSLSPSSITVGASPFGLTVNGANFTAGCVVQWNGGDRATTFVSATELRASIPSSDLSTVGSTQVTVYTPGGATSAGATFTISAPPSNWTLVGAPLNDRTVEQVVVDSSDPRILYVASDTALIGSRDAGATWATLVPNSLAAGVIAPDPNNVNRVFYGEHGTLHVSTDRGLTWSDVASFNGGSFVSLVVSKLDSHSIFVGLRFDNHTVGRTTDKALFYRSTDDGASWQFFPFGDQAYTNFIPWSMAEDPLDGTLYVGVELGDHPQPYHPPFFRSADRGATWVNVAGSGDPSQTALWWHVTSIAIDPATHEVFALQEGGGLYASTDHGTTWAQTHALPLSCGLLRDPNTPNRFFADMVAGTMYSSGAFISINGANTFMTFGLEGMSACSFALTGDSKKLYAAAYGSGIWVTPLQ
jgi:IPT/TIG domain